MFRSMTGFGRAQEAVDGRMVTVEIKSVNHRYLELNIKTSRGYAYLEEKVKTSLQQVVSRGKIDVYIGIEAASETTVDIAVNTGVAQGYVNALREISERFNVPFDLTAVTLADFSDVLSIRKSIEEEDAIWVMVKPVFEKAAASFISMREAEGERLKTDILSRCDAVLEQAAIVEERSPQLVTEYRERLYTKLAELLTDIKLDDQRLIMEAAVFADKIAVAEEITRLRSHFIELRNMLNSHQAVGRKLDFLIQEVNREVNTIGSKSPDSQIARTVVDIKAEIEKIREQVQNIE